MKIFTTLGIIAAFGLVWGCSSDGSSSGTGGAAGGTATGGTSSGGTSAGGTGGMAGSSSGGTSAGGTSSTGGAAGNTGVDCQTCAQTSCSSELATCGAEADCLALLQCALACTDQACVDQCATDHPTGKAAWDPLEACIAQNCATECG